MHPKHMSTSGIRHRGEHRPEHATCQASLPICKKRQRWIDSLLEFLVKPMGYSRLQDKACSLKIGR